ncbi:MAG: hypothetical protein AVDCRST_MAG20-2162 [uncultured Acidimicrobiales bacterium]|uniref:Uncharacterized protein n=1 Tax=uncultured Acidimicrobiales bacterium TaxID=310071 RepID=A0A6J4ICN7_9ACTN|nr:MAG: hypothetical protein AVDCRST_MAG20-2162 [uncultured Acidimicrobiales bacterium]
MSGHVVSRQVTDGQVLSGQPAREAGLDGDV